MTVLILDAEIVSTLVSRLPATNASAIAGESGLTTQSNALHACRKLTIGQTLEERNVEARLRGLPPSEMLAGGGSPRSLASTKPHVPLFQRLADGEFSTSLESIRLCVVRPLSSAMALAFVAGSLDTSVETISASRIRKVNRR
ncbi:MAG: hypothetical protein JO182_21800 [Acidobacteriaceae bacterium]|nr:hypothetical protein [Acidobacteriaceae bacterium]